MRIRHVACIAPPRLGGIGMAALRQVEALRARGHAAELIVPDVPGALTTEGVRPWPVRGYWGNAAWLKELDALCADTDVLHLHYPFYGTAERLLLRAPRIPVVLQFHMDAHAKDWRNIVFTLQRRLLQPRMLNRASKILVASRDYAEQSSLTRHIQEQPEHVEEVPFFLDETAFIPPASRLPSEFLHCLFVGALDQAHAFKGLPLILEAMTHAPWARLTIVGDGAQRPALVREIARLGLEARITLRGKVSEPELIKEYQRADVLLFPSISQAEAFGLVALEAQACGTPVIASRLPGVRCVVRENETGWLIEPGSAAGLLAAMERAWRCPEERLAFGCEARLHVERTFARDRVVDQLEALYQTICASPL